jgi:hypothetical protein
MNLEREIGEKIVFDDIKNNQKDKRVKMMLKKQRQKEMRNDLLNQQH